MPSRPASLGQLRHAIAAGTVTRRPVKDEIRDNLIARLRAGETMFPGIIGYDETVVPQIVNAILSRHNFILLGLRGQAKSRILRGLEGLLDDVIPVVPGCEIHDDPLAPICAACRARVRDEGDALAIGWLERDARYVEKLATPDVTIADMIGDLDPIKAARSGLHLADEMTMHYGLLPRANRGIFAINELPDLAGKIQVGLFNILQEGDVQIKGYPRAAAARRHDGLQRKPRGLHRARQDHHAPQGPDRVRDPDALPRDTPARAWRSPRRKPGRDAAPRPRWTVPDFVREIVEEVAFQARQDPRVDKRSGVSQRLPIALLENVISNAERRALLGGESPVVPRVTDIYAALPAITGKFELEYEGELRGADNVAREIIRAAVGIVFSGMYAAADLAQVTEWFELGGTLNVDDTLTAADLLQRTAVVQGLHELSTVAGVPARAAAPLRAAAVDFVLEGLYAQKKISRSDDWQYQGTEQPRRAPRAVQADTMLDREIPMTGNKKKYYN